MLHDDVDKGPDSGTGDADRVRRGDVLSKLTGLTVSLRPSTFRWTLTVSCASLVICRLRSVIFRLHPSARGTSEVWRTSGIPIQTFILPYHRVKGGQAFTATIAGSLDTLAGRTGAVPRTAPQGRSNIGNAWGTLPQSTTFAKPPRAGCENFR